MSALPAHVIEQANAASVAAVAIARGLKLRRSGSELVGPCPRCGTGDDRFAINPRRNAFHCRVCGVGGYGALAFVRFLDGIGFVAAVEAVTGMVVPARPPETDDTERRKKTATSLWSQRQPIGGTVAETYLREARGYGGAIPATLCFLPAWRDRPPAMIAPFGICTEIEPGVLMPPRRIEAVHLTFLRPDGSGKADMAKPKQGRGVCLGSPIVLAPPNDLLGFAICEGVEDGLSVHAATGLGAWASWCAGNLPEIAVHVPDYIESVTIFAHDDADGSGQRGARALAAKLIARDIEVFLEGIGA